MKYTIEINLSIEQIKKGYMHYYGVTKPPTKKEIQSWIGSLSEADILDCASHDDDVDEDDRDPVFGVKYGTTYNKE